MKKAVCFDLFWTLVAPRFPERNTEFDALGMTAKEYARTFEEADFCRRRNEGEFNSIPEIMDEYERLNGLNLSDDVKKRSADARLKRIELSLVNPDPAIFETIQELKAMGYTIALISNADNFDYCYWDKSPLKPLFDYVTFSGKIGCVKPKTEIYETALKKMDMTGSDCWFVGDGGHDELLGARNCGFTTVLTEYLRKRQGDERQHIAESADFVIKDFRELKNICR